MILLSTVGSVVTLLSLKFTNWASRKLYTGSHFTANSTLCLQPATLKKSLWQLWHDGWVLLRHYLSPGAGPIKIFRLKFDSTQEFNGLNQSCDLWLVNSRVASNSMLGFFYRIGSRVNWNSRWINSQLHLSDKPAHCGHVSIWKSDPHPIGPRDPFLPSLGYSVSICESLYPWDYNRGSNIEILLCRWNSDCTLAKFFNFWKRFILWSRYNSTNFH